MSAAGAAPTARSRGQEKPKDPSQPPRAGAASTGAERSDNGDGLAWFSHGRGGVVSEAKRGERQINASSFRSGLVLCATLRSKCAPLQIWSGHSGWVVEIEG